MDGVTAYMIDYRVNYQVYLDTYLLIVALAVEGVGSHRQVSGLPQQERLLTVRLIAVRTRQGVGYRLCVVIGTLVLLAPENRVWIVSKSK